MSRIRYVLLMRHAKHNRGKAEPDSSPSSPELKDIAASLRKLARIPEPPADEPATDVLKKKGRDETSEVAAALSEVLAEQHKVDEKDRINLTRVVTSTMPETKDTKKVLVKVLEQRLDDNKHLEPVELAGWLDPGPGEDENIGKVVEWLRGDQSTERSANVNGSDAVLIVGHDPMLGWLSEKLVGEALPQVHSEILCLDLDPPARLVWTLTPSDEKTLEDLREKIRKKMELAGTVGGFITAGIGFLVSTMAESEKAEAFKDHRFLVLLALVSLFVGVIFYLLCMFSYDSLLMPKRFWSQSLSGSKNQNRPGWIVARPPSSANWILYQNMIHIWQWQFIPATLLALYGLYIVGVAVLLSFFRLDQQEFPNGLGLILALAPLIVVEIIGAGKAVRSRSEIIFVSKGIWHCPGLKTKWRYVFGPWLGSED